LWVKVANAKDDADGLTGACEQVVWLLADLERAPGA
jgi:hypothetical protein